MGRWVVSYSLPNARFRPIGDSWPGTPTKPRDRMPAYRFRASWPNTIELLWRELRLLDARQVVVQVDVTEGEIRQDGLPRANARPSGPGVILAFESRHGPLRYACDAYDHFQANIRAIALSLEALRAVDRHGITKTGEQYRGWQALPAPTTGPMSVEAAARFIADHSGGAVTAQQVLDGWHHGQGTTTYRLAAARLHPDRDGGNAELFVRLQEARQVLDQHGTGS
jgi:hypothetical protein